MLSTPPCSGSAGFADAIVSGLVPFMLSSAMLTSIRVILTAESIYVVCGFDRRAKQDKCPVWNER
jgi:hypothetical protein